MQALNDLYTIFQTEPSESKVKPERPGTINKDDIEKENKDGLGVKVKRKGRRGRSSGSLTMKGDKITSFTTERGITYAPNGLNFFQLLCRIINPFVDSLFTEHPT